MIQRKLELKNAGVKGKLELKKARVLEGWSKIKLELTLKKAGGHGEGKLAFSWLTLQMEYEMRVRFEILMHWGGKRGGLLLASPFLSVCVSV